MVLDYLYYKLHQATLKGSLKDVANIASSAYIGSLIASNTLVINGFLAKIFVMPFLFSDSRFAATFCLILIIITKLYYNKKREKIILEKYSSETNMLRVRGNIFISLYVALSFLLIFAIAFYKPGHL